MDEEVIKEEVVEEGVADPQPAAPVKTSDEANAEYKGLWQRALADYQNLQREVSARRQELVAMSELQILEEFIPVYDNFKKAFSHHPNITGENKKQLKGWIDGIGYIMKQFAEVMKNHNVEEIKTVGEKFDITRHESVGEEEVDPSPPLEVSATLRQGEIIREVDGGYTMSGRVIKVAKVIVAK